MYIYQHSLSGNQYLFDCCQSSTRPSPYHVLSQQVYIRALRHRTNHISNLIQFIRRLQLSPHHVAHLADIVGIARLFVDAMEIHVLEATRCTASRADILPG